jgi:hypothetical protein
MNNAYDAYAQLSPNDQQFDMSASKVFPIHEKINLELRAEACNLLNYHNLVHPEKPDRCSKLR